MDFEKYFSWWVEHKIYSIFSGILIPIIIYYLWGALIEVTKYSIYGLIFIIPIIFLIIGPYYSIVIMIKDFF